MSKVLIFSDIHVHPHQRDQDKLNDCLEALSWVFEEAKARNIKNILFAGDLFHDRKIIDIPTYHKVAEIFIQNMTGDDTPNFYLLLGNHDLYYHELTHINSSYPLSAINGVTLISKPSTIKVDGVDVSWLPYTHDPEADIAKIENKSKRKIMIGHVAIDGAWLNSGGSISEVHVETDDAVKRVGVEIFDGWDNVFLGHYHAAQHLSDTVEYIGSPLQLSWGEANQKKHIILFDLETGDKEYIENTFSRSHIYVSENKLATVSHADYVGQFICLTNVNTDDPELLEHRRKFEAAGVASIKFKAAEKDIGEQIKDIEDAKSIITTGGNMVDKFLEKADLHGLDKDRLSRVGNEIISKADA